MAATRVKVGVVLVAGLIAGCWFAFLHLPRLQGTGQSVNARTIKDKDSIRTSPEEVYLIPDDQTLSGFNKDQRAAVYWRYVNTLQVLCRNQARFGSFKDGGKEICLDSSFRPKRPCLVYSFGSNYQFDFEVDIIRAFGCEVHTFDPSMSKPPAKAIPKNITFHPVGLGGQDEVTKQGWKIQTLHTIMQELGHLDRNVDIIKIDIEGAEWTSLPQMFEAGTLHRVKQLAIEFHYSYIKPGQLNVLRDLHKDGFEIFMRDRNPVLVKPITSDISTQYTPLNELSLINRRFRQTN